MMPTEPRVLANWEDQLALISLWEIMQQIRAGFFVHIGGLAQILQLPALFGADDPVEDKFRKQIREVLGGLENDAESFGLSLTAKALKRLFEDLDQEQYTNAQLKLALQDLIARYQDELDDRLFFRVSSSHASYLLTPQEGWREALDKFPSVFLDVEEASRCFALGRYTASVFHLMRVLEVGLVSLALALQVPTSRSNWGRIIDQIQAEITKRNKAQGATWPDQQFYSAAAAQFQFLKDAWRNHVIHRRLSFDEQGARQVYVHVRDFMCHLALKLVEAP